MSAYADIAVAILAAGQGRRFGSDKLMADLCGVPMGLHIAHTLVSMPFGWRFAVCCPGTAPIQHFSVAGFDILTNEYVGADQSTSLHVAVAAAEVTDAAALLVVLADMPFVSAAHIAKLVAHDGLMASTDGHRSMPPALFPRSYWPELRQITGDNGARGLLRDAKLVFASTAELRDIDLVADLPKPPSR